MSYDQGTTPDLSDLIKYAVNRAGQTEVLRNTLYDFQVYPVAGQQIMLFFQVPKGAGITSSPGAVVGTAKTLGDTNMLLAGQLPNPQGYLVESIELFFEPGASATANTFVPAVVSQFTAVPTQILMASPNDKNAIKTSGLLRLTIGAKDYLVEAPLGVFPPKTHIEADVALATNSATTSSLIFETARFTGRPYYLDPPVTLMATQNFSVSLEWPGAIPMPSGFNGRIGIKLDGYQFRNSQ